MSFRYALLALAALSSPASAADVVGTWLAEGGKAQIRIAPCGVAHCGTIVWTKAPAKDGNNPSPELRNRNLIGVQLVSNARQDGADWAGTLYNPTDGRSYTGRIHPRGDELEVSGCVLAGLICRTQTWTRVR